jgi:hypothetical protein
LREWGKRGRAFCGKLARLMEKLVTGLGCITTVIAPLLALVLFPRANWLFFLGLVGVTILVLTFRGHKDPTPDEVADYIERLLTGNSRTWDVDDFEGLGIREPRLRELWQQAFSVSQLPESWAQLDDLEKDKLREIISRLQGMNKSDPDVR